MHISNVVLLLIILNADTCLRCTSVRDCYYFQAEVSRTASSFWFNFQNNLPKSMNCFIESGDGENLENLSTCFGMLNLEVFFSKIWANFILNTKSKSTWTWNVTWWCLRAARARRLTPFEKKANLRLALPHSHYSVSNSKAVVLCTAISHRHEGRVSNLLSSICAVYTLCSNNSTQLRCSFCFLLFFFLQMFLLSFSLLSSTDQLLEGWRGLLWSPPASHFYN